MPQLSVPWLVSEKLRMVIWPPKIQDTIGRRFIRIILRAVYSIKSPWGWQHHKEADRMPCPNKNTSHKKRNISPWHGVQSASSMTKNQSGNITVTTLTCFAANCTRTYHSNVRCMLIICSRHKTNILSFTHIWQKYGSYSKSKCKPFAAHLSTI